MDDRWERTQRRHRIFGISLLLLVLAIAVGAWYAYPILKRHETTLAQVVALPKVVNSLGEQVRGAEDKLQRWSDSQHELSDRVTKLGQRMEARMEAVRKQAKDSSAEILTRVQAQIENQKEAVEGRLVHLESASDNEQTRVAELQRELGQVRRDLSRQTEELSAVRRQVEESGANHDRQLASLKDTQDRDRRDVNSLSRKLSVRRVDFEVTKNHSQELAEGVSLGVTGTDVRYRKVNGWMWLMPDRRTIWLKGQGAQEPVVFYGVKDGKKREMVITNVTKNSITGYLLLPDEAPSEIAAARPSE
jgi:cell division protein FtsB